MFTEILVRVFGRFRHRSRAHAAESRNNQALAAIYEIIVRIQKPACCIVSFRYACVGWRLGCELRRMGSLSHIFRKQGIHIIADPVTEVMADGAYFIESGDQGMTVADR